MITYINSVSNTKNSLNSIFNSVYEINQDSLYANDIIKLIDYNDTLHYKNSQELIKISRIETVELIDVSYKYKSASSYSIKNFSFLFESGKNYIITGKNGSGKSTIIKIILGLYSDYEGKILINGINLKKIEHKSYISNLSAVFQDFTKFQFTLKESISISEPNKSISEQKISSVVDKANIDFVNKLPYGYDQQLGNWFEGGKQLSGGEWQKVAIARAMYKDNVSLVIMDEPSSSLDPISEFHIYNSFRELSKSKIGIFITHRIKNIKLHGEIIFMESGKIEEKGNFDKLISSEGKFFDFYKIQISIDKDNE